MKSTFGILFLLGLFLFLDQSFGVCVTGCETCQYNETYCLTCSSGYFYTDSLHTCTYGACPNGYYLNNANCAPCNPSCATCPGSGPPNQCLSCPNGKVLSGSTCADNCLDTSYPDANSTCQQCLQPCSSCTGPNNGQCKTCVSPFVKNGTSCINRNECNGYIDNEVCLDCNPACQTCSGPSTTNCLSCSIESNTYLYNGECKSTCPDGYLVNGTICQKCPSPCLKCSELSTDKCTTCTTGYLLNGTTCITDSSCLENGYTDDSVTCKPCHPSCKTCSGPSSTSCSSCQNSYLLVGACLSECPPAYFPDTGNKCSACKQPCGNCTEVSTKCTSCISTHVLNGTNSYTCTLKTDCEKSGYVVDNVCQFCDSPCQKCYGPGSYNCSTCATGSYLNNGTCVTSCPTGFYGNVLTCSPCDPNCLTCAGPKINDCRSCSQGLYSAQEGRCGQTCPLLTYPDPEHHLCANCATGCLTCDDGILCTACKDTSQILYQGSCIDGCPSGLQLQGGGCVEAAENKSVGVGVGVGVSLGLLFIVLIGVGTFLYMRREKKKFELEKARLEVSMSLTESFVPRPVTIEDNQNIDSSIGQTLLNTHIDVALPGFLLLDYSKQLRVEKQLSSGGAGDLYIATLLDQKLVAKTGTENVVVKHVKPIPGFSPEKIQRHFHNEITINWVLSTSPNIIKMIGYTENPKSIVSKLYERDLFSLIQDETEVISKARILHLTVNTLRGIQAIHSLNAAHRDLKTKNVLIERGLTDDDTDIRAVLCDFGLAVVDQQLMATNADNEVLKGFSPKYASPEVFVATRTNTNLEIAGFQKADVYAFGVILWELLTRKIPWDELSVDQIEFQVRSGNRLKAVESTDVEILALWQICQKCWMPEPSDRPTIQQILSKIETSFQI